MDKLARNALRLSLAGAGVAVLGAGFVGQASAAELPAAPEGLGGLNTAHMTDSVPSLDSNNVSLAGHQLSDLGSKGTPSADSLPSLDKTSALQIPSAMNLQAPDLG